MSGFDTTPKPGFLRAMQNQRWTVAGALSELVDNSFGLGRGNANRVVITHDPHRRTISVLDDGRGMEAVGRLFQLGNTIGRTPGDIGLYGSGGTMAVLWLASKVEVWTLRDGKVSHDIVDWPKQIASDAFPLISDDWEPISLSNTPAELVAAGSGTFILLRLSRERRFYPSNVQRDLAATYAPAVRMGKTLIWRSLGKGGGDRHLSDPVPVPADEQSVEFDLTMQIRDDLLNVIGRIGHIEGLAQSKSYVNVGYGPRVILKTRDCYAAADGSVRFVGSGVTGWLQLGDGWQPYLATTKDAMNDQPAWETLMEYVFEKIRPLLERVETDELSLLLDDIGLQLEEALNGRAKIEVGRAALHLNEEGEERTGRGESETPKEREPRTPADTGDEQGEALTKDPAVARIGIFRQSEQQMNGLLCRADVWNNDSILVMVNQDHHVVDAALRARPINRMALHLLITREIAHEIAQTPSVIERMFSGRALKEIDDRGEIERPAFMARLLMDRVRDRVLEEPVA